MEQLRARNDRLARETIRYAEIGCAAVATFRGEASPAALQTVQEGLMFGLLETEALLRRENERDKRRRIRWKRFDLKTHAQQQCREQHLAEVRRTYALLRDRREVLRQCGDALAWLQLRGDPRQLFAWFAAERNHHLTPDVGLDGLISLIRDAHATGKFLVVCADITRCIGKGDIVVTRADGNWVRPLVYELKTHSGRAELELLSQQINHPADEDFHREFQEALGLEQGESRPISRKTARQWDEIREASATLIEVTQGSRPNVRSATRKYWGRVKQLLSRAAAGEGLFDSPEHGVVYVAWNSKADGEGLLKKAIDEARNLGVLSATAELIQLNTGHIRREEFLARAVPPIALWDLPLCARADLLTGELTFAAVIDASIWTQLFRAEGVELQDHKTSWHMKRGKSRAHVDQLELRSVIASICFAGVSPAEIVQKFSDSITE